MSVHYTYSDDVALLTRANALAPWSQNRQMEAWEEIATALSQVPSFPKGKDGRSVRSRCYTLLRKHADNKTGLMRKCGRSEEFQEREQLLESIQAKVTLCESIRKRKRSSEGGGGAASEESSGDDQPTVGASDVASADNRRNGRNGTHHAAASTSFSSSSSTSITSPTESRRLDLMERQLEYMKRQLELQSELMQTQREQFERQFQLQQQQLQMIVDLVQRATDKSRPNDSS